MNSTSPVDQLKTQLSSVMLIPSAVFQNWPAFFGFALVDFGLRTALQAIPRPRVGLAATIVVNAVRGMVDVTKFVAWEKLKHI
jgi:hypothetical protein